MAGWQIGPRSSGYRVIDSTFFRPRSAVVVKGRHARPYVLLTGAR